MIQGGIDKAWLVHSVKKLRASIVSAFQPIKAGITNASQEVYQYWLSDGNELDYTASIAGATTVTFSELPSTTVSIYVNLLIDQNSANVGYIYFKRSVSDSKTYYIEFGGPSLGGGARNYFFARIPTYQNSIYVSALGNSCTGFYIFGYGEGAV